ISRAAERMFSCVCELTSALKTAGAFGDSNDKSFTYIFCSSSCLVVPVFAGCSAISVFLWLPAVMPRCVRWVSLDVAGTFRAVGGFRRNAHATSRSGPVRLIVVGREQRIEPALRLERVQVVVAADVGRAEENLRDGASPASLDHLLTPLRLGRDVD